MGCIDPSVHSVLSGYTTSSASNYTHFSFLMIINTKYLTLDKLEEGTADKWQW